MNEKLVIIPKLVTSGKKMMTIGRASDVLIHDVQEMLVKLQKSVGFEYIKLSGIFSDDLHVYSETSSNAPIYSFTYLDKIFDFVIENHLKPWIQLSYIHLCLYKFLIKTRIMVHLGNLLGLKENGCNR